MQRQKPPFRAGMVGSLLRPLPLKDARAKHAAGAIDDSKLRARFGGRERLGRPIAVQTVKRIVL